ncbi:hypothetical protein AQ915_31345 [Burkholderia pseudomallei]|uniref:hypothetical protein n=1 Tax=Burkholderia pseudomallei TaxID=28450 RepID=UPI0009C70B5B|nr:hypothetical protein [Burkholderia pseudomallei]ONC40210.1 hypothetical protein AQ915_31345 [Burkholderia pseudomallei]
MTAGGARRGARVARRSSSVAWRTAHRASRMELARLRRMGATMRERALARRRAPRDGGRVLLAGFACMHAMRSFARVRAIRASTSGFSKRTRSESRTGRRRCSARSARTCSTAGSRTTGG